MDCKERIKELKYLINYHNKKYYDEDESEISDSQYDALVEELKELDKDYCLCVGLNPNKKFKKFTHSYPMLSLGKTKSVKEVFDFFNDIFKKHTHDTYIEMTPKLDGIALELVYVKGKLSVASTRGNSLVGEVVTEQVLTISNIPKKIKIPATLVVRGEVVIHKDDFNNILYECKSKGLKTPANARNLVSGTIRQTDKKIVLARKMYFYAFHTNLLGGGQENFNFLKSIGFQCPTYSLMNKNNFSMDMIESYKEDLLNRGFDYEIDGIVINVTSLKLRRKVGETKSKPRWAIALKPKDDSAFTILKKVYFQVGARTGKISPVAIINPVFLGGVTISRVSLVGNKHIIGKDLRIGDIIEVVRAGGVIPKVISVSKSESDERDEFELVSFPKKCPHCENKLKEGDVYYCENERCAGRLGKK